MLTLTSEEHVWLRNRLAHLGAFGEVDYTEQAEQSYWEAQVMSNPDGNTTGEHVPGTVDGTDVNVTSNRQEDQRQYNDSQSLYLRGPDNRPQGAVTVGTIDADGVTWERTCLPGSDLRYDGTAQTQREVAATKPRPAARVAHRTMTSAEREALRAQRERERKALENGEDLATIERDRAAYLAKRAKRCGEDSAAVIATALAEGSASWGGGNTATVSA